MHKINKPLIPIESMDHLPVNKLNHPRGCRGELESKHCCDEFGLLHNEGTVQND